MFITHSNMPCIISNALPEDIFIDHYACIHILICINTTYPTSEHPARTYKIADYMPQ